jgi:hypothetical protein
MDSTTLESLTNTASALSLLKLWVEAFELDAGILGSKLPVNSLVTRIASLLPWLGFMAQCLDIGNSPIKTLPGEGTQLNFGDIAPAAVFGCMVDLQPVHQRTRLLRRIGFIEGANPMRIEIITHQAHPSASG